jgi:magnesium-transporting ATPase (P-type)
MALEAQEKNEGQKATASLVLLGTIVMVALLVGYFLTQNVLFLFANLVFVVPFGIVIARRNYEHDKKYNRKVGLKKGAITKTLILALIMTTLFLLYDPVFVGFFGLDVKWPAKVLNASIYGVPMIYLFTQVERADSKS